MESLPDELILLILSFVQTPKTVLNSLPFVCKKWQLLCKQSVTGKLDFSICEKFDLEVTDELVCKLRSRFKYIDTFRLDYDVLQDNTIINLSKCCKLYKLGLSNTDINSSVLSKIMENKNIRKLNLHCCKKIKTSFLTNNCNLEYLNLSMADVNDVLINNIANYCPKLKYLNVSFCRNITNQSFLKLLSKCKKLNTLIITGCTGLNFDSSNFKNISKIHYLGTKIK